MPDALWWSHHKTKAHAQTCRRIAPQPQDAIPSRPMAHPTAWMRSGLQAALRANPICTSWWRHTALESVRLLHAQSPAPAYRKTAEARLPLSLSLPRQNLFSYENSFSEYFRCVKALSHFAVGALVESVRNDRKRQRCLAVAGQVILCVRDFAPAHGFFKRTSGKPSPLRTVHRDLHGVFMGIVRLIVSFALQIIPRRNLPIFVQQVSGDGKKLDEVFGHAAPDIKHAGVFDV